MKYYGQSVFRHIWDIYSLWVIQSWNYRFFILVITVSSSGYFSGVGGIC